MHIMQHCFNSPARSDMICGIAEMSFWTEQRERELLLTLRKGLCPSLCEGHWQGEVGSLGCCCYTT